ncbi:unnamed protein product [Paramecium pentaurelia]|uniref:Uncharacterized protein n=1 Tax=Paramecium pentaurelia TaxID=43138 RepID=A0A8S1WW33_9CILI|nr:unnamed protein product [Paramecium pentaurelia]
MIKYFQIDNQLLFKQLCHILFIESIKQLFIKYCNSRWKLYNFSIVVFYAQDSYEELLELRGLNSENLSYVETFKKNYTEQYYTFKEWNPILIQGINQNLQGINQTQEVSLEQADEAQIQLFAFLFGPFEINDIISSYKEIAIIFNYKSDPFSLYVELLKLIMILFSIQMICLEMSFHINYKKIKQIVSKNLFCLNFLPRE